MKRSLFLLAGIILLYVIPSLVLQAVYGPSYGFMAGEDCWVPDNSGGWTEHGHPDGPAPTEPSQNIPIFVRYVPIFLPGILLILFTLTPLARYVDGEPDSDYHDSEGNTVDPRPDNLNSESDDKA